MKQTGQPKQTLRSNLLKRQQQKQQQQQQQHNPNQTNPRHANPQQKQQQQPYPYPHSNPQPQSQLEQQQQQQYQTKTLQQPLQQPLPHHHHQQQQQQHLYKHPYQNSLPPQQPIQLRILQRQPPKPEQSHQHYNQHQSHALQANQQKVQQEQQKVNPSQPHPHQEEQRIQRKYNQQQQLHPGPQYSRQQHQQQDFQNRNKKVHLDAARNIGRSLRKQTIRDRELFQQQFRNTKQIECLYKPGFKYLAVARLIHNDIKLALAKCDTMDHQILTLREKISLDQKDFEQRYQFTKLFLDCLMRHHNQIYEGILFGSTINGLGFKDSDVDLKLRLLKKVDDNIYEPQVLNDDWVERTLRDVAYQTNICAPCNGEFVPSTRCPVAKLSFLLLPGHNPCPDLYEGLKYDVSLSSNNSLGSFNTLFLRFLCYLEPKFHLLATVIRYWTKAHKLIVPGYLSSYAVVNMLIFFCQVIEPPLLPTIDHMRDLYFTYDHHEDETLKKTGLTQMEWHCIICLKKELYIPSRNNESLSVLLLKFFEFYLKFPYSTHIITTRPGKALTHDEFKNSSHFHPGFPLRTFLNIQDPFDLRHNVTSGMNGDFFKKFISVLSHSYEVLFYELMNRFHRPKDNLVNKIILNPHTFRNDDLFDWGLNALFVKLSEDQMARKPEGPKKKDKKLTKKAYFTKSTPLPTNELTPPTTDKPAASRRLNDLTPVVSEIK